MQIRKLIGLIVFCYAAVSVVHADQAPTTTPTQNPTPLCWGFGCSNS